MITAVCVVVIIKNDILDAEFLTKQESLEYVLMVVEEDESVCRIW